MLHSLLTFPARRPVAALCLGGGLLVLLAITGVLQLRLNTSLKTMFPQGKPSADAMVRVLEQFPATNELILVASFDEKANANVPDADRPKHLADFADRLERDLQSSPDAAGLTAGVVYKADPAIRKFGEQVIAPAGLYYLDDAGYAAVLARLTPEGMAKQIDLNLARFAQPGAGQAMKEFFKDPLGLIEFVLNRLVPRRPFKTYEGAETFVSADGQAILVRVVGTKPPSDLDYCAKIVSAVKAAVERTNADGLTIHYTGAYAVADFSQNAIRKDSIESIFVSVFLLQALFLVVYRRPFRQFLLELTPVLFGVFVGFGVYGWLRGELSPVAAVIGGILAGMGIDYSVLYLAAYMRRLSEGKSPADAVALTAAHTVGPMFFAWFTTAIGFAAIAWSSVPTLRDFGLIGAVGLGGVFVSVALLLPAAIVLWDNYRLSRGDTPKARRMPFRWDVRPMLELIYRYRRGFIAFSIGLFVVCFVYAATRPGGPLPMESDLHVMHPQPNPALATEREIARRFGAEPGALLVHLKADTPGKLLALAHEVDRRLGTPAARSAGVAGTMGVASLLPDPPAIVGRKPMTPAEAEKIVADFRSAMNEAGFEPPAYESYAGFLRMVLTQVREAAPATSSGSGQVPPDVAASVRDATESIAATKPATLAVATTFSAAGSAPSIESLRPYPALWRSFLPATANGATPTEALTLVFVDQPTDQRGPREKLVATAREALSGLDGATLTGLPVISLDTEQATRRDLPLLLSIAGGCVVVVLLIYYRSVRMTALAMLPLIFSLTVLAAVARLTDTKLNLINLVALPLLIGIDVDYGIYLVSSGKRKRRTSGSAVISSSESADATATASADSEDEMTGGNATDADGPIVTTQMAASAQAVITCAIASMLGFGSLAWVSVPAVRSLGVVVAVGVFASLLATFALRAPVMMSGRTSRTALSQDKFTSS